jgi:hypothetical protein
MAKKQCADNNNNNNNNNKLLTRIPIIPKVCQGFVMLGELGVLDRHRYVRLVAQDGLGRAVRLVGHKIGTVTLVVQPMSPIFVTTHCVVGDGLHEGETR